MDNCLAQRSLVIVTYIAPGGDLGLLVAALQSRPRERQIYVTVLAPGGPRKFGTRDLHLLLGVSKYVAIERGIFSSTSFSLDLESRWR